MVQNQKINKEYQFTDSTVIRSYIYGKRGKVLLVSPSGKCHLYLFNRPKRNNFPEDVRFVYCVHTGHQDILDVTENYLGMIENGKFRCTLNSRFDDDAEVVKGAKYIVRMANEQELVDTTKMRLYNTGICAYCGRPLESEKSIRVGYGPRCLRKKKAAEEG